MRIRVQHQGLVDLEQDLRRIPSLMYREGTKIVQQNVREGGQSARRIAKWTSGRHAKLYPSTITWDRGLGVGSAFGALRGQYGPEPRGQGKLAPILENGSRNNPAHNNLLQSLDLQRPKFHRDVEGMLGRLFWPGAGGEQ